MSYTIVEADIKNNKDDILGLMNRNLSKHSEEWYAWKYENCPSGSARCWLVKDENSGNFIGTGALFARKFSINYKQFYAGLVGDFAIDKNHRSLVPALKLQKHILVNSEKAGFDFIYGIPNELSVAVLLKAGYVEMGKLERFVKLIRTEYKLKTYIKNLITLNIVSVLCNFILRFVSREEFIRRPVGYDIKIADSFDIEVDRLLEKAKIQFKNSSIKNSIFLNWRYYQTQENNFKIMFLVFENKESVGYVVFSKKERIYYIEDVFFVDDGKSLDLLISEFIRYARKQGIDSVSLNMFGNSRVKNKLAKFGFILRETGNKVVVYSNNPLVKPHLLNRDNWFFLNGDNDV